MRVMIRYRVKRDQVAPTLELLRAVYEELESTQPDGLRYATFQLEDEVSFVAFVESENGPGAAPHHQLKAFQRYRATLDERCDEPPVVSWLHEAGSFRFH
jgi:quinol monooxygenase YgiN